MKSGTFSETLVPASIDWKDNEPRSTLYDDIYFMPGSGIDESRYVFLEGNNLRERFAAIARPAAGLAPDPDTAEVAESSRSGNTFNILETGFGTGLNFILTCALFAEQAQSAFLNFVSFEKHPLRLDDLRHALSSMDLNSHLQPWAQRLLERYPPLISGFHHCYIAPNVRLTLALGDARELLPLVQGKFQAFYLDGFAPAKNPDFWDKDILVPLGAFADQGATLATFSAAGSVKRLLIEAGFQVEKKPGYGSKREMIIARFHGSGPSPDTDDQRTSILHGMRPQTAGPLKALVIGAGLAGCSAAYSLALRGISVTVADQNSNGPYPPEFRGIFHPALAAERTAWHRWTLAAYEYLRSLLSQIETDVNFCGVFQSGEGKREMERLGRATANLPPEVAILMEARAASERCGVTISHDGVFFPGGGVLSPLHVCNALLEAALHIASAQEVKFEVHRKTRIAALENTSRGWRAASDHVATGKTMHEFDVVVLASGPGTTEFELIDAPFDVVRGQMHNLPEHSLPGLRSVICHAGYIAPGVTLAAGSTYDRKDLTAEANLRGQNEILEKLRTGIPDLQSNQSLCPSFVGLRIACRDRMPLIGPVVGKPGLYVSAGHGSRGILSSPLAGEIIAAHACGDPLPVERDLFDHFSNRYVDRRARPNRNKGTTK